MSPTDEFTLDGPEESRSSMLDDILATDEPIRAAVQTMSEVKVVDVISPDGFHPLNLAHLNATDWSVIVGALMQRLGVNTLTLTPEDLRSLDAPPGMLTVLCCTIHPETTDVRFTILNTPKSEFRS
jgi:hypothetical protein